MLGLVQPNNEGSKTNLPMFGEPRTSEQKNVRFRGGKRRQGLASSSWLSHESSGVLRAETWQRVRCPRRVEGTGLIEFHGPLVVSLDRWFGSRRFAETEVLALGRRF